MNHLEFFQRARYCAGGALGVVALVTAGTAGATNGHVLHGVGSVNQAMGGAGIATSLDALGSLYNNPASIAGLTDNRFEFGFELFMPDRSMSASASGASGSVDSQRRAAPIPAVGLVHKTATPWTLGFAAYGIGGFGVDYPSNLPNGSGAFNPLAAPQANNGFGAVYSNYQLLQMTPVVAYDVTPALTVGGGLDADWASLSVAPWPATVPNSSGYPTGTHAATAWGWGLSVGATYRPVESVTVGAVLKSPQWFQSFRWNSQYPDGTPANFSFRLDYPLIAGLGVSVKPKSDWVVAADVKWIDYRDAEGFSQRNFAMGSTGPYVRGFGWNSIWTFALGTQYRVTHRVSLRAGYNYGQNPIPAEQQFFNVFAPAVVQHTVTVGLGFQLTPALGLDVAYYHAFAATASGPLISNGSGAPLNQPLPSTQVTNRLSEDSVSLQFTMAH